MKRLSIYANIRKLIHKCVESALFPFIFSAFFLGCAAFMLAVAVLLADAAYAGRADFHFVSRILPMMTDSSSITAVLAVGGGAFLAGLHRS